jgi:hypothetical protein
MPKAHSHILPEAQKKLWPYLAPCKDLGFCLYGGPDIALHLGHRTSVDYDFFSHLPLDEAREKMLLESLPFLSDARVIQSVADTRTFTTTEGVALSFFGNISFGRVGEPLITEDGVLQIASLKDLMGTKLAVMVKRIQLKDYQDIAAILRHGMDLHDGLAYAQALYDQFPALECVRAMVFFEDKQLVSLSKHDRDTLIQASKKFRPAAIHPAPIIACELVLSSDGDNDGTRAGD